MSPLRTQSSDLTGIDNDRVLNQAFQAVQSFHLMDQRQVAAVLAKTQAAASNGEFELFKTTAHFDSTAHHPEWLGGEASQTKQLAPKKAG